jgi:ATP-dependent protease ClpP protease subunit
MGWIINNKGSHVGQVKSPKEFHINEFNDHTLRVFNNLVTECINSNQSLIPLYIESDGGRVDIMKGIMSVMDYGRKVGIQFATIVNSRAQSAGAMIFLYGNDGLRFMGENAFLMLHPASVGTIGKIGEIKSMIDYHHDDWEKISDKIGKHLKKPKGWMKKELGKIKDYDWIMTAQQAQDEKLCMAHSPTFILNVEESLSFC